jgi:hypothetical protein
MGEGIDLGKGCLRSFKVWLAAVSSIRIAEGSRRAMRSCSGKDMPEST